jgi:hypothetical protein
VTAWKADTLGVDGQVIEADEIAAPHPKGLHRGLDQMLCWGDVELATTAKRSCQHHLGESPVGEVPEYKTGGSLQRGLPKPE